MKQTSGTDSSDPAHNDQNEHSAQDRHQPLQKQIPANVRVMIALVASPTLLIIAFSVYSLLFGDWKAPGVSGIIFSALGIFAYYVVIFGRLPRWFSFRK